MNFFEHQDHARRQTRTLVILFALAVIAIILAVNAALALIWSWTQTGYVLGIREYPKGFFLTNTVVTFALIAGGTLIEMFNLRDGGDAVARMAGGRLVSPSSTDLYERRLLNVVEEMALASGIACPKVYLLDREASINAFAAGYNQDEAVVAVTQGTLRRLTRDELQGVVAHEFSHILNGDMRLNIRLIGLLFGIQMLSSFGHHLLDFGSRSSSSRSSNDKGGSARAFLFLTGLALVVIGAIGVFFGRLIKAAVSRQREFLADASAVQFTRNPDGIGNALRKIGGLSRSMELGSRIEHPNAEQLSHLFLGAPKQSLISGMLSTHPPIEERLRRIFGRAVEVVDAPELQIAAPAAEARPDIPYVASGFVGEEAPAAYWVAATDNCAETALPLELDNAVREPHAACAVVYALLLDDGPQCDAQLAILKSDAPQQAALAPSLAKAVALLPKSARLPLLDLAMPALKQLADVDRSALLAVANKLIAADNRLTLAEFVLQTVLTRRLAPHAGRATPVRFDDLRPLREDCALLLSLVAHVASQSVQLSAVELFARGAAGCAELGLRAEDLTKASAIDYSRICTALDHVHQLAPLAKPALIKALLAASGDATPMPVVTADLLRAICAALEAPVPPAVADTYTHHHW
ncbi:MAG TPA: M48 family metallopeptidase [Noviherbaspirillum sp.]|nr:M48 family metallopeptidase [Noviherbaspirillum sp.]